MPTPDAGHDVGYYPPEDIYIDSPAETAAAVEEAYQEARAAYATNLPSITEQFEIRAGLPDSAPPTVTSLEPNTAVVGGANFTIKVKGTNFTNDSQIYWGDHFEPTTFVSPTEVTTGVIPSSIGGPATIQVSVKDGRTMSNAQPFTFTAAE